MTQTKRTTLLDVLTSESITPVTPVASELLAPRDEHGEVIGEGW